MSRKWLNNFEKKNLNIKRTPKYWQKIRIAIKQFRGSYSEQKLMIAKNICDTALKITFGDPT